MAYFEFDGAAPQSSDIRRLKSNLLLALTIAEQVQAQNTEMTLAEMQSQFGLDAALTATNWETTIDDIVTALNAVGVTNFTTRVGFTTN